MIMRRKTLKNGNGSKKPVDMVKVYVALDSGRSVSDVANEWGVSPSTLYRRHKEYQDQLEQKNRKDDLPPLPQDFENKL